MNSRITVAGDVLVCSQYEGVMMSLRHNIVLRQRRCDIDHLHGSILGMETLCAEVSQRLVLSTSALVVDSQVLEGSFAGVSKVVVVNWNGAFLFAFTLCAHLCLTVWCPAIVVPPVDHGLPTYCHLISSVVDIMLLTDVDETSTFFA